MTTTRGTGTPGTGAGVAGGDTGTPEPAGASLGSGAAIRLIAGREIMTRLRSKTFLWTTFALVAVVVGAGVLLNLVSSQGSTTQVGLTPDVAALAQPLEATAKASGADVATKDVADRAAGEKAVRDGDLDALVTGDPSDVEVVVQTQLDPTLLPLFTSLAQQAALASAVTQLGGDPAQVAQDVATATPKVTALEPQPERDSGQIAAGFVTGILLFVSLMTAGQLVAQGVVEEKSSRVVELLLATVKPWQLMAGKVLGIGTIGLIQIVLVVGAGAGTALALGVVDSSAVDLGTTALWAIVWFVVGFTAYALALAALSALVSRQEDVGSVTAPVMTLMIVPYIIGVSIAPWSPDSPLVVWLSFVPFCAPLLMPMRIALGSAEPWEIALSLGLSLAIIPVLVWVAGRIYSNAVLRSGGRTRLRDAFSGAPAGGSGRD